MIRRQLLRGWFPSLLLIIVLHACQGQPPRGGTGSSGASRVQTGDEITASRRNAITTAVERVSPAVVGINVTEVQEYQRDPFDGMFDDPFFEQFFGRRPSQTYRQEVHGLGSGFIISPDGYVVTNDHVAGAASKVIVTTTDGRQYDAKIIGSDRTADVALLKIDGKDFPYLQLGNSDDVIVGEWAIAFGNPFGLFDINSKPTVTVGVISNKGVDLQPQEDRIYRSMLQTDAAISSGNSGGPLVNSLGEVIGINSTIYSTSQNRMGAGSIGIGFAIPINRAREIIEQLKRSGKIDRNFWTGMRIQQVDARIAQYLKLKSTEGVVVVEISANSPASNAGLEVGDVITAVNGVTVKTEGAAVLQLYDARVGDRMKLSVLRNGQQLEKILTLERRPG
ncbi:MAG TPA: trypsin-like peptidase domain-containing protein [Candidatus Kapabacteria bacterium]|nr:trypsin-like peptidase domain-containing protein [Candidatus Kapabacteria bacterium]